jgi:hypothetical protein
MVAARAGLEIRPTVAESDVLSNGGDLICLEMRQVGQWRSLDLPGPVVDLMGLVSIRMPEQMLP